MRNKILIFFIILILFVGFLSTIVFLFTDKAKAGSEHNVYGWAWSENIGWISFNCTDREVATGKTCLDSSSPSFNPAVNLADYGVNINSITGKLSGYARSDKIGWIKFNPEGLYPESPDYSACVNLPGVSGEACSDLNENEVGGWARACAVFPEGSCEGSLRPDSERGGWDGWIKLRSSNYGVSLDASVNPHEFRGWGFGGNDATEDAVIGWISFTSINCDPDKDGITEGGANNPNFPNCPDGENISNYKVMTTLNLSPKATNLSENLNYCNFGGAPLVAPGVSITLNWQYSDPELDSQTAYEIWVGDDSDFLDPKFNHFVPGSGFSYGLWLSQDDNGDWTSPFDWGTLYYWKVGVRDEYHSSLVFSNSNSFTMPAHAYPNPKFALNQTEPHVGDFVVFTDQTIFDDVTCKENPNDDLCSYYWTFKDASLATSDQKNPPAVIFESSGSKDVTLTATDSDGYSCLIKKPIIVKELLPIWREIAPF